MTAKGKKWDGKWRVERVPPPAPNKLPATDKYRENYDRIFKKDQSKDS